MKLSEKYLFDILNNQFSPFEYTNDNANEIVVWNGNSALFINYLENSEGYITTIEMYLKTVDGATSKGLVEILPNSDGIVIKDLHLLMNSVIYKLIKLEELIDALDELQHSGMELKDFGRLSIVDDILKTRYV